MHTSAVAVCAVFLSQLSFTRWILFFLWQNGGAHTTAHCSSSKQTERTIEKHRMRKNHRSAVVREERKFILALAVNVRSELWGEIYALLAIVAHCFVPAGLGWARLYVDGRVGWFGWLMFGSEFFLLDFPYRHIHSILVFVSKLTLFCQWSWSKFFVNSLFSRLDKCQCC